MNNRQNGRRRGRNNPRPQGGNRGGFDSGNRIDSRARGNAAQLLEKYKNMARDAQMSGDRVLTEYYLQFADHYFRVLSDARSRQEEQRARFQDRDDDSREEPEAEAEEDEFDAIDSIGRAPRQRPQERGERAPDRSERSGERGDRGDRAERGGDRYRREGYDADRPARRNGYDARPQDGSENDGRADRGRGRDDAERDEGGYNRRERGGDERRAPRGRGAREDRGSAMNAAPADFDDAPAAIDIAVLPPAIGAMDAIPMRDDFDLAPVETASVDSETALPSAQPEDAEAAPAPRRRGRPRKVVATEGDDAAA